MRLKANTESSPGHWPGLRLACPGKAGQVRDLHAYVRGRGGAAPDMPGVHVRDSLAKMKGPGEP